MRSPNNTTFPFYDGRRYADVAPNPGHIAQPARAHKEAHISMQNFRCSAEGLALTKRYEGLRKLAYQDSGGIWTIGYGHTGTDVVAGKSISELEAEALLRADLRSAIDCVNSHLKIAPSQNQFDALVDFCFNAGRGNFAKSNLLTRVNARDFAGAAQQFGLWINVNGQPSRGLQRRRAAEAAMFAGTYRPDSIA